MEFTWIDIVSLCFSVAAFFFSLWQFKSETERNRKEATIHAFDMLEENPAVLYLFKVKKQEIEELVRWHNNPNRQIKTNPHNDENWRLLNSALPRIEHFAVGINSQIYDIKTLNRMAGNLLITTWNNCNTLIEYKRKGHANQNNYAEFKTMVDSLKILRRTTHQTIPRNTFD